MLEVLHGFQNNLLWMQILSQSQVTKLSRLQLYHDRYFATIKNCTNLSRFDWIFSLTLS